MLFYKTEPEHFKKKHIPSFFLPLLYCCSTFINLHLCSTALNMHLMCLFCYPYDFSSLTSVFVGKRLQLVQSTSLVMVEQPRASMRTIQLSISMGYSASTCLPIQIQSSKVFQLLWFPIPVGMGKRCTQIVS